MPRFSLVAAALLVANSIFATAATDANAALVTTNLIQYLDADTNVAATGTNVTSWAPVSGTGDTVTTSTGSPQLNSGALNGRDTITFTADQMNGSDTSLFDFGIGGITWFAVARPAASANSGNIFGTLENSGGFDGLELHTNATNQWGAAFRSDSGPDTTITESSSSLGNWRIFAGTRDGNTVELLVDGVSEGTTAGYSGFTISSDALAVGAERTGGAERGNFDIAALLVYDTKLASAQVNATGYFLAQRFGIATAFYGVPEPSTAVLLGMGLLGLAVRRTRK